MLHRLDTWMDHNADLVGYLSALALAFVGAYVVWVCVGIGLSRF